MSVPESIFTAPRQYCPRPDRWHAIDDLAAEIEISALVAAMVTATRPHLAIETGTHVGHTALQIGRALTNPDAPGQLITLEICDHLASAAETRCAGLPVTVIRQSSLEWEPECPIDFAWFDSETHLRGEEFRRFLPWMHERTIVGFHDTAPHHSTRTYIDPLVDEGLLEPPLYLPTPRGVCWSKPIINHVDPGRVPGAV
jgi:predicted O-methyltransferase YrrM